jgi:hypothetical protein
VLIAELDAAPHGVRGRHHLDSPVGEVEAAVGAALDHALELAPHVVGAEMAHRDVETAMQRGVALAHLGEHRPRHDVARRPLAARVVARHEPLAGAVEEIAARAAQALLDDRAGHARVRSGEEAGRMELHHLHVAQAEPGAQRHREAVARLVAGRRVVLVHRRAAAGREHHRFRAHQHEPAGAHVGEQHAGDALPVPGGDQLHRAVLLQAPDAARPDLLGEPVDDLDAGEIALVDGAVEGLSREGLLVQGAVGVAVEEAAELVLELAHALHGDAHERPGELLVRQPRAALDRVHEVALDRIAGGERDVVAALDHARAAALPQEPLDRDRDVELRVRLVGVQRGEEAGAAGTEDQEVSRDFLHAPVTGP